MRPLILSILAAATVAAIPAAATAREKPTPEAKLAKLLEGRVAGDPQDCLPLSSLGSSQVIDGTAIVYRSGATLWVNRPRGGAESLDDDDILVTKPTGGQLCSIDVVQLRDRSSHFYSGFVSLGQFVPYRRAKAE
ncbi:MAG: hypothetical protein DI569_02955 [Sphingopyxis macrogoltabida]|uniref:Uncharacterized protein n=1 Tax=Sphingopyxis macrogoltabida TaxID=33050 RepID=A0A2W5LBB9_SPHMC|nr:MAG: hypothetical protein DI569_02955 [Sphingopyxis macrogoltabida]